MSTWSNLESAYDAAALDIWGEPIIYEYPPADPFTLNAIRLIRSPDEIPQDGGFEGYEIRESDFTSGPDLGAWVTLSDGVQYVVADIRDPHPFDGKKTLILNRRAPLAPNA